MSGNFEDQQAQIPGRSINWNKGIPGINYISLIYCVSSISVSYFSAGLTVCPFYADSAHLLSLYSYPNLDTLRAALRYHERSWAKLLNFKPTYRYSGRRKARVTDFLLEDAPEPDPTLPQINLVPLTADQEMAKKNRVRALLTETNRSEVPPPFQTQETVVALPSQQPSTSRANKRARTNQAEQRLADEDETILPPNHPPSPQPELEDRANSSVWSPTITFQNRAICATDSVVADKDHTLAFNLAKSVCLPPDMEHHKNLTELKAIRSATKSMILVSCSSCLPKYFQLFVRFCH